MDILQKITERYPINLYLPYVDSKRSLKILWDESLPVACRREIEQGMKKIPLYPVDARADLEVTICQEPCPGEEDPCLALRCEEKCFYFADEDPCISLLWTLYAMVQTLPFIQGITCAKIIAVNYSSMQQSLASSLLASAEYWQGALTAGVLAPILKAVIAEHAQGLVRQAPAFSSRPVTESGWAEIQKASGLFAKKKQVRLQELAEQLFGQGDFVQELDAYCALLPRRDEFTQAVDAAFSSAAQQLYRLPLLEFEVRLNDAINELKNELSATNEMSSASKVLDKTATVKHLGPDQLRQVFEQADSLYTKIAEYKVKIVFLEALAERLKKKIAESVPRVLSTMQSWNRVLRPFCKIGTVKDKLDLGWDCCETLSPEQLRAEDNGWDGQMLYKLQTSAGIKGRYYLEAWLCSTKTYELCRNNASMFLSKMVEVPGLTEQLMIAFMAETIQEQHTNE